MTTKELIKLLNGKIDRLKEGKVVAIAAQDTHVKMSERIFDEHKNAIGGKIGEYNSTNPIYVNPKNSPKKFPTKGKPSGKTKKKKVDGKEIDVKVNDGKDKFKNGDPHKTGYFESYKAFREKIGRQTDEVDLKLFGRLQSDFTKGVHKVDNLTYTAGVNKDNSKKVEGYNLTFRLTDDEKKHFKDVLEFESLRILK